MRSAAEGACCSTDSIGAVEERDAVPASGSSSNVKGAGELVGTPSPSEKEGPGGGTYPERGAAGTSVSEELE